ncbi:hypothetical protein GCM10010145_11940 [Streptomyces ruber]|uniref:Uncharacterized protein n=2 Tax=Streptomyces TaxID=1883 RepID=A0A918B8F1_9ACTN|nr:hypothetical protein [Streptomyces ruber]GGQ44882.1 hypothetical protein GCM10010145_11940 [Streptomyces ruber]
MTAVPVEAQTWLVGRIHDQEVLSEVTGWWLDEDGVNPLTVGTWTGCRDGLVMRGTVQQAARVAAMRELVDWAERASSVEECEAIERVRAWVLASG